MSFLGGQALLVAGCHVSHRRVISLELRSLLMLTFPAVVFLTAGAPVKGATGTPVMPWPMAVSQLVGDIPSASLRGQGMARNGKEWQGIICTGEMDVDWNAVFVPPMWPYVANMWPSRAMPFSVSLGHWDPRSFSALRFCCHTRWMRIFGCC